MKLGHSGSRIKLMEVKVKMEMLAFDDLCTQGNFSGPASEQAIGQAQNELKVVFPQEYKEFLERYGAVLIPGAEIFGLPDTSKNSPPLWNDVISVTLNLREQRQYGSENVSFIPIAEDGTGVYFFLNTHASPRTEILAIGLGVNKLVSSSLYEFVLDLAGGRLQL
jgi:hypothetical protein